ncbi:MAG: phytanoyl-CoA dioxygenase family protein [Spirochaetia bacterium]|nr:phytanoyl-CoA dioxygenase family protein [Spirochaetia bacterium]
MLNQEQLNHYHEQGWVVVKNVVPLSVIQKIKKEISGVHEFFVNHTMKGTNVSWEPDVPKGSAPKIQQLMGSEIVSPSLGEVIRSKEIVDMVEQIIGPEIELFHSKLLMKAPNVGGGHFPWHQDYGYWTQHEKMPVQMNCALAIDPQTIENGCLHYVPGSQKSGLLNHMNSGAKGFAWGLPGDIKAFPGVPVEYEPGDICFFGPLVIHGSEPNRTNESAVFNTCAYAVPGFQKNGNETRELLRSRKEAALAV